MHLPTQFCWPIVLFLMQGDVYPVEPYDGFPVSQVLDAHWGVLNDEDVSNLFVGYGIFLCVFEGFLQFRFILWTL